MKPTSGYRVSLTAHEAEDLYNSPTVSLLSRIRSSERPGREDLESC